MKRKLFILGPVVFIIVLMSCSMPQGPAGLSEQSGQQPEGIMSLSIETDTSRNQGVYVNEYGHKIDIRSIEGPEGTLVNCVEAIDIAVMNGGDVSAGTDSGESRIKAIVVGKRDDGQPGAWEIHSDDSIHSLWNEEAGLKSSLLPESYDRDEGLRGRFGWVYYVTDISEDGKIAVGYAENNHGFKHPKWGIEPGTTIGVYWRLWNYGSNPFFSVSRARVIGTAVTPENDFPNWRGHNYLNWLLRRILNRLKLFFLNWLEAYLIMADSVHYDSVRDLYIVSGTDQDGKEAIATIDARGNITITPVGEPGEGKFDLEPGEIIFAVSYIEDGQLLSITLPIENKAADTVSTDFKVHFYLSTDTTFDAAAPDEDLGTVSVTTDIPGGSTVNINLSLTMPEVGVNQSVYIYAVVDSTDVITENDENNNKSNTDTAAVILLYDDEAVTPRSYDIVFETFLPTGSGTTNTVMTLYKDVTYETESTGNTGSDPLQEMLFNYPCTTGTYYLLVRAFDPGGPYALSVRTNNIAIKRFGADLSSDPYASDDDPTPTFPYGADLLYTPPISVDVKVGATSNRYSGGMSDWDWFKIVLP